MSGSLSEKPLECCEQLKHVRIPVVLRDGSNNGRGSLHFLKVEDICNITTDGRILLFETKDKTYCQLSTLDEIDALFAPVFGFEKVDRSNYVQPKNVTLFDSNNRLVYFDLPVTRQSKFATVAYRHIAQIKQWFGEDKDIARRPTEA